jgi:hypothetical protein
MFISTPNYHCSLLSLQSTSSLYAFPFYTATGRKRKLQPFWKVMLPTDDIGRWCRQQSTTVDIDNSSKKDLGNDAKPLSAGGYISL